MVGQFTGNSQVVFLFRGWVGRDGHLFFSLLFLSLPVFLIGWTCEPCLLLASTRVVDLDVFVASLAVILCPGLQNVYTENSINPGFETGPWIWIFLIHPSIHLSIEDEWALAKNSAVNKAIICLSNERIQKMTKCIRSILAIIVLWRKFSMKWEDRERGILLFYTGWLGKCNENWFVSWDLEARLQFVQILGDRIF